MSISRSDSKTHSLTNFLSFKSFSKISLNKYVADVPAEEGLDYYVYEFEYENVSDKEKHIFYGSFVCYADNVLTTQIYGGIIVLYLNITKKRL